MARLWQSGFEQNSNTTGIEFSSTSGSPTIQSTTVRSGTYAGQVTSLSSGTRKGWGYQHLASGGNGPYYAGVAFRYATLPSASNTIMVFNSGSSITTVIRASITLESDGTLKLWNGTNSTGTQIGSPSSALSADTWYIIQMLYDASPAGGSEIIRARLAPDNGTTPVEFAGANNLTTGGAGQSFSIGGNLALEAQTTGNWYFDDFSINDASGSFQNSYPTFGKMVGSNPNATGDANAFATQVGGVAGAANNFTRVNEVTPDDATSYNASTTLDAEDLFNCEDLGIGAGDTINVVAIGVRMANLVSADATAALKVEIEKTTGGTKAQSAALIPNSTTWITNAAIAPRNYPLVTYQDPDGAAWTKTTLDSMQVGYIQTATNAQAVAVSKVWVLVEYTPAAVASRPHSLTLVGVG